MGLLVRAGAVKRVNAPAAGGEPIEYLKLRYAYILKNCAVDDRAAA
jgi:hypothetical protein